MHKWSQLTGKELKLLHARLEHYIATLYQAKNLGQTIFAGSNSLDALIDETTLQRDYVAEQLLCHKVESRHRPRTRRDSDRSTVFLFLDECGGHETNKIDSKFRLCSVVGCEGSND